MSMPMLTDILKSTAIKSTWLAWVVGERTQAAQETRFFLDSCFSHIRSTRQKRLLQRIQKGDSLEIEAAIHELVAHELLRRLGFSPEFDPQIINATPDMSVEIFGDRFIADVFVTHNPRRTILEFGSDFLLTRDSGERAQKIAETIREKSTKYAKTNLPLILFVFLGDHSVSIRDVERALFGITIHDIELTGETLWGLREDERIDSVFLSEDIGRPRHSNISAVIACDWFDTLNRANPGKRRPTEPA